MKYLYNWGYDNFCHRNASVTKLWLLDHIHIYNRIWFAWYSFVGDVMDINYDSIIFISKNICFKNFADIFKIATMFGKTTFRLKKVLKIINYISSNVDEAMKTTSNFLFFAKKFCTHKKHKKHISEQATFFPLDVF